MKITIESLPNKFTGTGEVEGFEFLRLRESHKGFLYQVDDNGDIYYEIFKAKPVGICIDFEKRLYSNTHFKCPYPKAKDFGHWAWTTHSFEKAEEIFERICKE